MTGSEEPMAGNERPRLRPPAGIDPLRLATLLTLALGIGFRLADALERRSFWVDEASLALNVMSRGFTDLFRDLDLAQVAPPLYLALVRGSFLLTGPSETSLRTVSLVTGILLLFIMVSLARMLVGRGAPLLVLAVLAPMPWLIRYSNEVKPYIVDIFAAALLLWLTARVLSGHRERWSLPLALFLLPLVSLPAIFCGAGVLCALVVHHGRGALRERTVWTAAAAWLLGSGLTFLFTKNPSQTAWSLHYWEGSFAFRGLADGYVQRFLAFYAELAFVPPPGLRDVRAPWLIPGAVVLVGAGVVHLWRRGQRALLLAMLVPVLAGLAASAAHRFPMAPRLWMWILPSYTVLLAAGVFLLLPRRTGWVTPAVVLLLWAVAFGPRARWAYYQSHSPAHDRIADRVLAELDHQRKPDEPVWVHVRGSAEYLAERVRTPEDGAALRALLLASSPGGPLYRNDSVMRPVDAQTEPLLTWRDGGGPVLLARSSAMRERDQHPVTSLDPDWARTEAARIRTAADPCAWTFMIDALPPEREGLLAALAASGGRATWRLDDRGTLAARWCFARERTRGTEPAS
ncbi:MAG: glycosyltransferase family 39 protein [Gemmatimonadota bacterium]|nr:glycosyltransferase family 39 protein [Gemmatimonadota bacterium]